PVFDALWPQTLAQMQAKSPQLTPEQIEGVRKLTPIYYSVSVIVITPISVLVVGLLLWIVGKLFDAEQRLGDATMVATFASSPRVMASVAAAILALLLDPSKITSQWSVTASLGHFVNGMQPPVLPAMLGRVDVFVIWTTVLLAIGLSVTGNLS